VKKLTVKQQKEQIGKMLIAKMTGGAISANKDGSVMTKPIFNDMPDILESKVLEDCLAWLKSNRIFADRNNVGEGQLGCSDAYYRFGIKNGGDIIGCLPNGRHFEIECKRGRGGKWSKGQQERCVELRENNGLYFLVHGTEELEYYFRDLI
jgi:hypothetical protein